ncbi:MAG: LutC/YkgG family protein [Actinomycetota bacterium]
MSSREVVLGRIRLALRDVPPNELPDGVEVPRRYRVAAKDVDPAELFAARVEEYQAEVHRVDGHTVSAAVRRICEAAGVRRLVVPPGIERGWLPAAGIEIVPDAGLTSGELDGVDGILTGCALAIGETGTIVLDGGRESGRRAVSLIPDTHLCVVRSEQVVALVPEAIERLGELVRRDRRPLTFVSGPSATSDIEFRRVEGVHGPRHLHVLLTP